VKIKQSILVTGGAGFIGSNFVLHWNEHEQGLVVNLDKLTYAGNLKNLRGAGQHHFVQGDINDRGLVRELFETFKPVYLIHFAAESHVDRSITGPGDFIRTNINGTFTLLEEAKRYWEQMGSAEQSAFRFLHVSTDEVYGSLSPRAPAFTESTRYEPNSPYSASKAAADHLVRAFHHTYGLPTLITNCSNNYGPFQFPEKLIPLTILNALEWKSLPVYGDGMNVRDWLFVRDHCEAIVAALKSGEPGETYNIGGDCEKTNLEVVRTICATIDKLRPAPNGATRDSLITFVKDRPGHDRRYAVDASKILVKLGWKAQESFESGIRKTVEWYLENPSWIEGVRSGAYRDWIESHYSGLTGLEDTEREKTAIPK
jgi:dTDP-glucose 4,6-dehydratase